MGDRVLMQVVKRNQETKKTEEFGPVIYCHWSGSEAPNIIAQFAQQMNNRRGDVAYQTARLLECCMRSDPNTDTGFGCWNARKPLTASDSHGDAGVYLIDADTLLGEHL